MAQSHTTTPALNTQTESGKFDEKQHHTSDPEKVKHESEEDEDEDIDALIEDLESQDGHGLEEDEEEGAVPGGARVIPEDMLQTDTRIGSSCQLQMSLAHRLTFYYLQVLPTKKSLPVAASKLAMPSVPMSPWLFAQMLMLCLQIWHEPDEGGEREPHPEVLQLLCRSHPVRHG